MKLWNHTSVHVVSSFFGGMLSPAVETAENTIKILSHASIQKCCTHLCIKQYIYIYYIPIAYGHGKALTILPPLRRDIHTRYGTNLTALVETAVLKKRKETNSVKAPPNMLNTKTLLYIP